MIIEIGFVQAGQSEGGLELVCWDDESDMTLRATKESNHDDRDG
jgi:hypothetical protein